MTSTKQDALKRGEIVKAASLFGMPGEGVYKVDSVSSALIQLSCGEIRAGCHPSTLIILERNLPEPVSWLNEEIKVIKEQLKSCDCVECRNLLKSKERALAGLAN